MKLQEIADRIYKHLMRFERDKKINAPIEHGGMKTTPYYHAQAYRAGRYVGVRYIGYQGTWSLSREEALNYLAWLDAGNVGKHLDMEQVVQP